MPSPTIIKTLLQKNSRIIAHHKNKYLLIYLSPFLILALVVILQHWTDSNFTWENPSPPVYSLSPIPKCYGEDCLTLGYIVSGKRQPYIDAVINHVKRENNLTNDDVKQINLTKEEIFEDIRQRPNKTQSIIIFCTDSKWIVRGVQIPCYADDYHLNFYTILYNVSLNHRSPYMGNLKEAYPKDLVTLKLKKDIDHAIILFYSSLVHQDSTKTPAQQVTLQSTFKDYPNRTSRFILGVSLFANYGSFFIMIPYLVLLVMQSSHLLHQKEKRLRIGLNIVGVSHLEYYISELITYAFSAFFISVGFSVGGELFQIKFFINSLVWFTFLSIFINGVILGLIAFNVMAMVSSKNLGMSLTYGFILYSIAMQWIFSGGFVLELLYLDTAGTIIKLIKLFFNLYPSFHFSKIFTNISRKADNHIDTLQNRYVNATEFTFDDLFIRSEQHYEEPFPHGYVLPSPLQSFVYLGLTSVTFLISLWIFDTCVESNRGYKASFFTSNKKRKNSIYRNIGNEDDEEQQKPIVSVTNLQKTYSNDVYALRGISMQLKQGEIVGLLGENGAGKSTLINIFIGALSKTKGSVIIDDKDVQTDIVAIRKVMGVCPQFDILWEQLTAGEHVEMFYKLKGFQATPQAIKTTLQSVQLQYNTNSKVSKFSGGMRRRLSLAISLIGNPKLIILDEPTTGMDAQIRLTTWKLILKIKKNRTVLITTHNMEEAECLSDTIIIMSKGRLIVEGSSVELKKKYGSGYVAKGYDKDTKEEIVLRCEDGQLEEMLKKITEKGIENWGLRETTLEEVFLNVNQRF